MHCGVNHHQLCDLRKSQIVMAVKVGVREANCSSPFGNEKIFPPLLGGFRSLGRSLAFKRLNLYKAQVHHLPGQTLDKVGEDPSSTTCFHYNPPKYRLLQLARPLNDLRHHFARRGCFYCDRNMSDFKLKTIPPPLLPPNLLPPNKLTIFPSRRISICQVLEVT
jgi:hypothetical protein